MWTELFMSGQTGQQHVTVTRGLDGEKGGGGEGRGGGGLRRLPDCVICGFMDSLMCR